MYTETTQKKLITAMISWLILAIIVISILFGLFAISKVVKVWSREMDGKAELAEAEWSKQIAIEEAKALKESAVFKAQAEVERSRGVAEANEIIAQGLKDNEEYIQYLYVQTLADLNTQLIYVPTEAGLPILEANRSLK